MTNAPRSPSDPETLEGAMTTAPRRETAALPRREVIGAWCLLAGLTTLYLGVAWDTQWHFDVGPDTFFTAPHIVFYAGASFIGLTCLAVVLLNTYAGEPDGTAFRGPRLRVLGRFHAPVAFLVGGLGSSAHLLFGATDLWWHSIYGFDIISVTPSHLGLSLGTSVEIVAVVMAMSSLRARRSGRWGLTLACTVGIGGFFVLNGNVAGVDIFTVCTSGLCACVLALVAGVTRSVRWVMLTGVMSVIVQIVSFVYTPVATQAYADALGLRLRDNAVKISLYGTVLPTPLILMSLVAALVLWFGRRRGIRPAITFMVAGFLVGPGIGVWYVAWGLPHANKPATLLAAAVFSALASWFGWLLAAMLNRLGPDPERPAPEGASPGSADHERLDPEFPDAGRPPAGAPAVVAGEVVAEEAAS
jgi:hypothetical protein